MSTDSPAAIIFGTDGYEVSVRDNTVLEDNINADGYIRGLLIAGSDGYKTHHIRTNTVGVLESTSYERATFNAIVQNIATGSNKSMLSLLNTSTKAIRIEEIYLVNAKTTAVTGISGTFEVRRISGHSAGSLVTTIETYETGDVLDAGVTLRTGSTVAGESANLLWKSVFSTDEHGIDSVSVSSDEHIFQTMFPIFVKKTTHAKTITLKTNEGLTIKFLQNSTVGSFDIFCVFTQE
jgi:hypothetical protein